ncbi:uncharacterized protein LOC115927770 [Strongylocentrotus purpuratus]|uniref:CCHC-type domain-containing protein n=1 Tax=Strongylocentrotus purpuratus TaxID=7668 RepID=A0A7M7PG99_STRPU|nr:uncharacterized protein LOC115927770 [Strongylocentrotus purpuratus]
MSEVDMMGDKEKENPVAEAVDTRSKREVKLTEKGLQYQAETKGKEFKRSISAWRRASNKLRATLSDISDVKVIRQGRDALQQVMDKAISAQEDLQILLELAGIDDDSHERLDNIEQEHSELMKGVQEHLLEQESSRKSKVSSKRLSSCQKWVNECSFESQDDVPTKDVPTKDVPTEDVPTTELPTKEPLLNLLTQLQISRLPLPEPDIFSGDPLQYPSWKQAYDILMEHQGIPARDRFFYLKKYLRGPPLELVQGFSLIHNDMAYNRATSELEQRYGDPFIISNAFRDRLDNWPKIPTKDSRGLRRFSDYLRQCQTAIEKIGNLRQLDDERENRKLLSKLPDWLVTKWSRRVYEHRRSHGTFPSFGTFSSFIEEESNIACDPITSIGSLKEDKPKQDRGKSMRALTMRTSSIQDETKRPERKSFCIFCRNHHHLEDCQAFVNQPMSERKKFIREKGLCYGCLKRGHLTKKCRVRSKCRECNKRHPTPLHFDRRPSEERERTSNQEEIQSSNSHTLVNSNATSYAKSAAIVPVWLSHENMKEERLVYALLDTQSDTTFILNSTKDALGLHGLRVNLLLSTMSTKNERIPSEKIKGLTARAFNSEKVIHLPAAYTRYIMPANREHIPTPEVARSFPHLVPIADQLLPLKHCEIGLLIGYDCGRALTPRDVIPSQDDDGPFGMKTDLGWSIVGVTSQDEQHYNPDDHVGHSHRLTAREIPAELAERDMSIKKRVTFTHNVTIKEEISPSSVLKLMERDFSESRSEVPFSQHDTRFMRIMSENVHITDDGHYETPLPFKEDVVNLPNNRFMAERRLSHLKRKFQRDSEYHQKYSEKMDALLEKGYAESVPEYDKQNGQAWYIPHHGVVQPNKLRVVFDCSAEFGKESLNKQLLSGPDLTNTLVGVLCRFRLEPIAFCCDIREMFYQFKVKEDHRKYLRYLWWKDGDFLQQPHELRMTVHLFGATSSPGCSNFCLKQIASDHAIEFGEDVKNFVHHNFYVDDGLISVPTKEEAKNLISRTREMCKKGGLHLHKFISNTQEVLETVPEEDRAKGTTKTNLLQDKLPLQKALGVQWCVESDTFQFRVTLDDRPLTRRGILSTVMSIYDPMGLLAPIVLPGKQILQELCKMSADWDDPLPDHLRERWEKWTTDLHNLDSLSIQRCYKPADFGEVTTMQMHHFSDASSEGYGQCSYMRIKNGEGRVHCILVMAKSRIAPLKAVTIPRLELSAAVVSIRVSTFLQRELALEDIEHIYWTDSNVVLGYINNESKRFHVFVANRICEIRQHSESSQWKHVRTQDNPADGASRGFTVDQLITSNWFTGPDFLWEETVPRADDQEEFEVSPGDPEVKKSMVNATVMGDSKFDLSRLDRFPTWYRAKRAMAYCLLFITRLKQRCQRKRTRQANDDSTSQGKVSVQNLQQAETEILRHVQSEAFGEEIEILKSIQRKQDLNDRQRRRQIKKESRLHGLDTFLDKKGILRVGGRIRRGDDSYDRKHPLILPQRSHVTDLVIRHCHELTAHQGRGMTLNQIRENGFWVLGSSNRVANFIRKCVICNRLRSPAQLQKMSDLPSDRVLPAAPFTYCGIDCFGPWVIKEGRKEMKRYGLLFTCMPSRAVHIETLNSLTTDSFIQGYRRFAALRGPIRQLRCDRGTNFVGAEAELRKAWSEMNHEHVKGTLMKEGCDYVQFTFNVPAASHMGGVWERQIRSARRVLETLLYQSSRQLNDESLRTLMYEAAAIVNSRPLTVTDLNDPTYLAPLTPNHLITMKSKVLLPPPGNFQDADLYSRKRWRRVQHLINEFWDRWRKEFLQNLQTRQKWTRPRRDAKIGDIVIMKEENLPRNQWSLARISEVFPSTDGLIRKVKLVKGDFELDDSGKRKGPVKELERPIHKLVLLLPREDQDGFPTKEP